MYTHILIATDGSELASKGLEHGLSLAKPLHAKVTVLTVSEPLRQEMASAARLGGIEDPVEAMTEGVVYTLTQVHRTPHLGILLTSTNSSVHPEGLTSQEAQAFGMAMITRFDVDWVRYGYDDASLQELVEYVLRTMQSFFLAPGDPKRSDEELRRYLRRWMGSAIIAQSVR